MSTNVVVFMVLVVVNDVMLIDESKPCFNGANVIAQRAPVNGY